jgi:hypothetical protein
MTGSASVRALNILGRGEAGRKYFPNGAQSPEIN